MAGEAGQPLKAVLEALETPPPLEAAGPRRRLRLAAVAKRGRRTQEAKEREPEPVKDGEILNLRWINSEPSPTGEPAEP
jgi:hypothetical protein